MSSRIDPKAPRRALSYWGVIAPPLTAAGESLVLSSRRPFSTQSIAKPTSGKPKITYWGVVAPPLTAAGKSLSLSSRRPVSRSTAKATSESQNLPSERIPKDQEQTHSSVP